MRRFFRDRHTGGSITVEACLTLPVFLSVFFLLLFLVKFTCTGMVLDYAVNETAKEIAASVYPLSYINEFEDEKISEYGNADIPAPKEELEKLGQQLAEGGLRKILNVLSNDSFNSDDINNIIEDIAEDYRKGIIGSVINRVTPAYWNVKSAAKYKLAEAIIKKYLDNPLIKRENVILSMVEFPQGKAEHAWKQKGTKAEKQKLTPDKDYGIDDVVVQLEYRYKVKLPFIEALDINMVHIAVEKAWIYGSFGVLTVKDEGFDLDTDSGVVFITRTGIRYHKGSCWHLRRSRFPIELHQAKEQGYTPCKACSPET